MPVMDGIEATRKIRTISELPIIGLTGYSDQSMKEKCLAAGMDEVVSKPIRAKEVEAVLKRYS